MTTTRKFLRLSAVMEATGWSRATIWRKVKAGVLPAPISIGPRSIAWDAAEIAQWQQRCIDASRGVNGPFNSGHNYQIYQSSATAYVQLRRLRVSVARPPA